MHSFFGTDGIRTKVGNAPLQPHELVHLGSTLGKWITNHLQKKTILLAMDTRLSGPLIQAGLTAGLLQYPVIIDHAHVIPTPVLHYLVTEKKLYDVGIMITASHNTYSDNGIKIITQTTGKLHTSDETTIMDLYRAAKEIPDYENLGAELFSHEASTLYMQDILRTFSNCSFSGIAVILDCAHGAQSVLAPRIFKELGATVIALHTEPDGKNINRTVGSLHPARLQEAVVQHNAHIGFAFDGDGDRVIAVSQEGIIKDGDDLLALLLEHPLYQTESIVVGTIMSNQGFEKHVLNQHKQFIRTPVGDKYVIQALKEHDALLGAEPSGHVMIRDFSETADGLYTALRILESAAIHNNWALRSFKKFSQYNTTIPVTSKRDLSQQPFASLIQQSEQQLHDGRIIVRYSGTEPVLRIMVEDADIHHAQTISSSLCQKLKETLTKESL